MHICPSHSQCDVIRASTSNFHSAAPVGGGIGQKRETMNLDKIA